MAGDEERRAEDRLSALRHVNIMYTINENQLKKLLQAKFREGGRGEYCVCGRKYSERKKTDCRLCDEAIRSGLFFDCWGICEYVSKLAGKDMISFYEWINKLSERDRIFKWFAGSADFEKIKKPEPYAIVGFMNAKGKKVKHMGIVLADSKSFIHARKKVGISITRLCDSQYAGRIYGFFRYVGQ